MSKFWSDVVAQLSPYVPGEQPKVDNLIKLNTNENPYGPSPSVKHALMNLDANKLRLYPDPSADELKQTIANYYNLNAQQVFVGNGSDEVLAHCFQALLKQDKPLLFPDITYSFYPVYCGLYGIEAKRIPLDKDLAIDVSDYDQANGGIIFPNPNAPTGVAIPLEDIETLLQKNTESVLVIDEAYVDFGAKSAVTLIDKYPNLLVVQTVSKSRSLAGLRVGYAMGNAELITGLERVKNSFNSYPLDFYAQVGVVESFKDELYFKKICSKVMASRESLCTKLRGMGFDVLPSSANFVFVRHSDHDAAALMSELRANKIIVRYFNKPRIDQYLRITIGTEQECEALCQVLEDIIG